MKYEKTHQIQRSGTSRSGCPDEDLLAGALDRPARASASLETLLRRYRPWIFRRCMSWLGNRSDAEDVTQEVLMRVCAGLKGLEHRSRFRPWLARVVDNQCKTFLARRRRWVTVEHMEQILDLQAVNEPTIEWEHASRDHVFCAFRECPAQTQHVLYLRFFEDLTLQQMARLLDISLAATKMRLYRSLRRFGEHFRTLET